MCYDNYHTAAENSKPIWAIVPYSFYNCTAFRQDPSYKLKNGARMGDKNTTTVIPLHASRE